jgi:hypothetical protein
MPNLTVTITNSARLVTGQYVLECAGRPGLDVEAFDTQYVIDLIRSQSERHRFISDFDLPPTLSVETWNFDLSGPATACRLQNINELWFEIAGLFLRARLGFATSRILKLLEDEHSENTDAAQNARYNLHLDKMEQFDLAAFELVRIEDLVARIIYEYFGEGFLERVDQTNEKWEKMVTWDRMKDALNKRGKPDKNPHPRLEAMSEPDYKKLIAAVRDYRSADVLSIISYRDRRTHRVAPTVDHAGLVSTVQTPQKGASGEIVMLLGQTGPEFQFEQLYGAAKKTYSHLLGVAQRINEIIHA